ncbi:hypothetical protein [Streptomyces sp. NPDC046759]|uniref:hypothetical protein n=1 Tax=Streptomyces sp. NPDC046759 TaxID=3155019 RepID=UPI00340F6CB5
MAPEDGPREQDVSHIRTSSSDLPQPLRAVGSGLRRLPGAEQVGRVADTALDWIGAISPRGRRMAVYTGAGVLGVAGVVEWPLALTGAAVAWLTQPRPRSDAQRETARTDESGGVENGTARSGGRPAGADSGQATRETAGTMAERPGDRLEHSRFRHAHPQGHVHEQPAKVGDSATASALKQVAEASAHHREPGPSGEHHPEDGAR